ncbi:MAG: phosphatidylglycerol lysyltransferase domain-containing protein [Helicobacteraceae bacterium]|nr:phosphatidylglycerol lysyltransferase domain-containing protein [Helicobacteraceae bacterium]
MVALSVKHYQLIPFNIEAKEIMERYLAFVDTEASDYTFAQNYIWLTHSSGFYAIVNDAFCLFLLSGEELTMLLPPLGSKDKVNDALVECFAIMNEHNSSIYYSRIDCVCDFFLQSFVNYLERGTEIFEILESYLVEKKYADYIYLADDLIELKGNAYHAKRNEINKFRKAYPNTSIETLSPEKHGGAIIDLLNRWIANRIKYLPKDQTEQFLDGISHERFAIRRILKRYRELSLIGIVLKMGDDMVGFTVGEKLKENGASVLIEKTDFDVLGSAQYIFREFCKALKAEYNCSYINIGDDMGFENLRKVKLSYRPYKLAAKYAIYHK